MSLPYYKLHPAEHLGDYQIMSMPLEAKGAWYVLGVCQMWQHQGKIPDDPAYIAPLLSMPPEQWQSFRSLFLERGLIQIIDGHITIAAMRERWENAQKFCEEQREKQRIGVEKRKQNALVKKTKKTRG